MLVRTFSALGCHEYGLHVALQGVVRILSGYNGTYDGLSYVYHLDFSGCPTSNLSLQGLLGVREFFLRVSSAALGDINPALPVTRHMP